MRRQQAEAVGAEHAQQVRPRGVERRLLLRRAQAGGHDDRGARAEAAELGDQAGHRGRRRAQDGQVGRLRQVGDAAGELHAVERRVLRIDAEDRAGKRAGAQVAPDRRADAARTVGCADDGDRARLEQPVEMADAHRAAAPSGRDRDLQHAVALVGEQLVGLLDVVELEAVRHHRPQVDAAATRSPPSAAACAPCRRGTAW